MCICVFCRRGKIRRRRKNILYRKSLWLSIGASVWVKTYFLGRTQLSFQFGAAGSENVGMQLETDYLCCRLAAVPYLWCSEYDLSINLSVTESLLFPLKLVAISQLSKPWGLGTPGWLSGWASAFGSGHDPRVLGSSPTLGSCMEPACPSACVSASLSVSRWMNQWMNEWMNEILKKIKNKPEDSLGLEK